MKKIIIITSLFLLHISSYGSNISDKNALETANQYLEAFLNADTSQIVTLSTTPFYYHENPVYKTKEEIIILYNEIFEEMIFMEKEKGISYKENISFDLQVKHKLKLELNNPHKVILAKTLLKGQEVQNLYLIVTLTDEKHQITGYINEFLLNNLTDPTSASD